MSRQTHRLSAVVAYAKEKQSEWAAAAQERKRKEIERQDAIHAKLKQHATTILDHVNAHPDLFKPHESSMSVVVCNLDLSSIPDGRAVAAAWNIEYLDATSDRTVENKILIELNKQLHGHDGGTRACVSGYTNSHIVIEMGIIL